MRFRAPPCIYRFESFLILYAIFLCCKTQSSNYVLESNLTFLVAKIRNTEIYTVGRMWGFWMWKLMKFVETARNSKRVNHHFDEYRYWRPHLSLKVIPPCWTLWFPSSQFPITIKSPTFIYNFPFIWKFILLDSQTYLFVNSFRHFELPNFLYPLKRRKIFGCRQFIILNVFLTVHHELTIY